MPTRTENFYAVWRENCRAVNELREEDGRPPEKLLQAVWQQQRLHRDQLQTADGQTLRVLHPGFMSLAGGPDFRGAVLQIGGAAPVSGDVEIDLQSSGWRAHGHDRNPSFKNVILHVVWEISGKSATVPTVLALKNHLDAPVAELGRTLTSAVALPAAWRGQCAAPLGALPAASLTELLHAAAQVRLEAKAQALLARAKAAGWEQALWEYLFRALGYKNNLWPMQHLAETKSRWLRGATTPFELQARLLGLSGLLPDDLTRAQKTADTFLRRAWDLWWRDRDEFSDCQLPRSIWQFHGLRPANHPQRRLALAAHWLAAGDLTAKLEAWLLAEVPAPLTPARSPRGREREQLLRSLHAIFQVERDAFWSWHWTIKSARLAKPQLLLGAARVTDLAVNVILPWLWIRAKEGGNTTLQRAVEHRFFAWPAAEDNAVLKLARQRLLGTDNHRVLRGAAQQQGLLQIVRDFCEHANSLCTDCRFPDLVRSHCPKNQT